MTKPEARLPIEAGPPSDAAAAPARRRALLVAGMHRSGTSAVTRVLSLCGAALPGQLMGASEHNPKGYFESQRIFELHETLLAEAGTRWDDLSPFPAAWYDSPAAETWVARFADAVREDFGEAPLFALKDPRACKVVPLWLEVLRRLRVEPVFLIPVRNPLDVAASLRRAQGTQEPKGVLLWLQHFLAAERETRGFPRAFLSYDELLEDWRRVLARVEGDIGIVFPRAGRRAEAEVDEFLARELRHGATAADALEARSAVPRWVKDAYAWGLRAAAGEKPSLEELDAIALAMAPAELAFGPVVATADLAREHAEDELRRAGEQLGRIDAERERLARALADAERELAARRDEVERLADRAAQLEAQSKPLVDWVRSVLQWAGGLVVGGAVAKAHLDFAMREIDAADLRSVPQLASAGIRLAQQAAEVARLAEEADLRRAEAARLRADLEKKEAELARRGPEVERLAEASARELEAARHQVRALWQQITARDGALAAARQQAAASIAEAAAARSEVAAARAELASLVEVLRQRETQIARDAAQRDADLAAITAMRTQGAGSAQRDALQLLVEGTGPAPGASSGSLARRLARLSGWTLSFRLRSRLRERIAVREISASGLFDMEFYRQRNADVATSRLDPITHYVRHGAAEGRDPSPHFDTRFYLASNPDVAAAGWNPLLHYLRAGAAEGRDPSPSFDTRSYLAAHPIVAALGINPLLHWLRGARAPFPVAAAEPPPPATVRFIRS
jgi:hypothetical protein